MDTAAATRNTPITDAVAYARRAVIEAIAAPIEPITHAVSVACISTGPTFASLNRYKEKCFPIYPLMRQLMAEGKLTGAPLELMQRTGPGEELYDLAKDPDCMRNLAKTDDAKRTELSTALTADLKAQGDPRVIGDGSIFDRYEHANKGHVGFYERFMRGEKLKTGWVKDTDYEKSPLPVPLP